MAQVPGYKADIYKQTGAATTLTTVPIGTGDGAERDFYLIEELNDCEATTDWAQGDFAAMATDAVNFKEGLKSIKFTSPDPAVIATDYTGTYNPAGTWDWSKRSWFALWVYSERASAAFTSARLELGDGVNTSYWNMTLAATTWTRITVDLNTPDGTSGTACDLSAVTSLAISFVAADATVFYVNVDWMGPAPALIGSDYTILDAGVAISVRYYTLSASGYFLAAAGSAPAGALTATYDTYAMAHVGGAHSYSIDYVGDALDTSVFPTQPKAFKAGQTSWTATFDVKMDDTDLHHADFGTQRGWRLYTDTTATPLPFWTGWGILNALRASASIDSIVTEGYEIQGSQYFYHHRVDMPIS